MTALKHAERRTTEQRKFPRFMISFPISLAKDGVPVGDGNVYDLSAGGCAVESQSPLQKGDYLSLQLYLPDLHAPTTPLMVEVAAIRWVIQQKVGLEFIRMPSGDQERLRRFLLFLQEAAH